jgi:HSP20 family protein
MSLMAYDPFALGGGFEMDPWREMRRMTKRMNRMLGGNLGFGQEMMGGGGGALMPMERQWTPICDIRENDNNLILHAELPGVKPEDVKLEVRNGRLHLSGERKVDKKDEGERYLRSERFYGKFERSIPLPQDVDMNSIQANYDHGVLEVCIPKPKGAESKSLKINVGKRSGELPAGGQSVGISSTQQQQAGMGTSGAKGTTTTGTTKGK